MTAEEPFYHEADSVKVKLLQGVLYSDDVATWECLLRCEDEVATYFARIACDVEIDRAEGYAWLRQREPGEEPPDHFPPRLFRRVPISHEVTMLCVLLRERLFSFEKEQPDARKLVLSLEDFTSMLAVFLDLSEDEVRRQRRVQATVNQVVDLGFLKQVESGTNPRYEVRRILRAKISVEILEQIKEELKDHAQRLA